MGFSRGHCMFDKDRGINIPCLGCIDHNPIIMLKLAVVALAIFSVAQVLASPVAPAKRHDIAPAHLNKLQLEGKGLIGDIIAAEKAINEFILSCDTLYNQILGSSKNVVSTLVSTTNNVIAQMKDLGLDPEDIAAIQATADSCVSNIEGIVQGLLNDITKVVGLLGDILTHLDNPVQLGFDIAKLKRATDRLVLDFSTALDRMLAQLVNLKNSVIGVLVNHTGEIVDNIMGNIKNAEDTIISEYNNVKNAFDTCVAAGLAALEALNAIIS